MVLVLRIATKTLRRKEAQRRKRFRLKAEEEKKEKRFATKTLRRKEVQRGKRFRLKAEEEKKEKRFAIRLGEH